MKLIQEAMLSKKLQAVFCILKKTMQEVNTPFYILLDLHWSTQLKMNEGNDLVKLAQKIIITCPSRWEGTNQGWTTPGQRLKSQTPGHACQNYPPM